MSEVDVQHLHQDLIKLQRDISVIKHILTEEGELNEKTLKALKKARTEPLSAYTDINQL